MIGRFTFVSMMGMLLVLGCAVPAWQMPPGHPADPKIASDAPSTATDVDALKRYQEAMERGALVPHGEGYTAEPGRQVLP